MMNTSKRKTRSRTSKAASTPGGPHSPTVVPVTSTMAVRPLGQAAHATPWHHEDRHACIAKAAYFRSQHRGFVPGHELEDWLAAEDEVDQRLMGEGRAS